VDQRSNNNINKEPKQGESNQGLNERLTKFLFIEACASPTGTGMNLLIVTTTITNTKLPHVMGVPLRIVSSHQGTQKKKRYSRLRSKAETAKRQKEQRKAL
jgi:hypothetical protein